MANEVSLSVVATMLSTLLARVTEINERLIDAEMAVELKRCANPYLDKPPLLDLREHIKDRCK